LARVIFVTCRIAAKVTQNGSYTARQQATSESHIREKHGDYGKAGMGIEKERWQAQQRGAARKSIAETRLKAQLPYFAFGVSVRQ